jgi:molybdate transport system permease protein
VLTPLLLSLKVSLFATVITVLLGLPAAYLVSRTRFNLNKLLDALFTLPLILPPTVLGYYLLVLIGRRSPLGYFLEHYCNTTLIFTWKAAVLASCVTSMPLFYQSAKGAFSAINQNYLNAAKTLGRSNFEIFIFITIPLAWKGIMAGVILAFTRALGDFGATLMVAGNIPGVTQTMSIAIYDAVVAGEVAKANQMVFVITMCGVLALILLNRLQKQF